MSEPATTTSAAIDVSPERVSAPPTSAIKRLLITDSGLPELLLLLAVALAAYWPVMNNTFLGDDYGLTAAAGTLPVTRLWRLFTVLSPEFIRPVPLFFWWLQFKLFGTAGLPTHLFNTAFHAGSAWLLFRLLAGSGASRLAALMAALLFVVTPIAPEAVTWGAGRFDILALFFMLLALVLYSAYLRQGRKAAYAVSLVAVALALLSKEQALMLVFAVPAMELIYGGVPRAQGSLLGVDWLAWLKRLVRRLAPFFAIFAGFFILRYAIMGSFGGYSGLPKYGVPSLPAIHVTANTLMAPLSNHMFVGSTTMGLLRYTQVLFVVSLVLVAVGWKWASSAARRLYALLMVMFLTSFIPIFPYALMGGLPPNLQGSRFLYTPTALFLSLVAVGVLDFGARAVSRWLGHENAWKLAGLAPLALLLPVYAWGLNHNNRPWEDAAAISYYIPEAAYNLLPDPPRDAKLYFDNVPSWNGAYVYVTGLPQSIAFKYGRDDLTVMRLDPAFERPDLSDGYLFYYDGTSQQLKLERGPLAGDGTGDDARITGE